ncbi:MAG: TetR/AcrR family transcriptional regulator [Ideonella sp.]|nr:TetR/AcrR family transcriptional regulator [Ideonella sp.]
MSPPGRSKDDAAPPVHDPAPPAGRRPRQPHRPATAARTALTPEVWIEAATEVLVDQGIDHVRVDVLAQQLEVTRGSFYWHFRDRDDLLARVLQAWREHTTEQLTQRLRRAGTDPAVRLRDLMSLPQRGRSAVRAARIELAIRAWARRDPTARQAVDEADASRMAYQVQVFTELGFTPDEARHRAFVLYGHQIAEALLQLPATAAERAERNRFVERLVRSPLRDPA